MPPSDLTAMAVMAVLCILSAASRGMGNGVEGRKEERRGEVVVVVCDSCGGVAGGRCG
jgi:hypothetical protein